MAKKTLEFDVLAGLAKRPRAVVEAVENLLSAGIEVRVVSTDDPKAVRDELIEKFAEHGVNALRVDELLFGDEVRAQRAKEQEAIAQAREALLSKPPGQPAPTGPNAAQVAEAAKAKEAKAPKPKVPATT